MKMWFLTVFLLFLLNYFVKSHVAIHPKEILTEFRNEDHHFHPEDEQFCTPLVSCPAYLRKEINNFCKTHPTGRKGIFCTTGQNHTEKSLTSSRKHAFHMDILTLGQLQRICKDQMSKLRTREAKLLTSNKATILYPGPAAFGHFRNSRTFNGADLFQVMNVANGALELALATRAYKDRRGLLGKEDFDELEFGDHQDLRPTPFGHTCLPLPFCPPIPDKYRRIDGACNNILHPTWGAPFTAYSRILPANYQDGIWSSRVSKLSGKPLASPRLISTTLIPDINKPNHEFTLAVMQFGQFISHDFTQSMDQSYSNGSAISCCSSDGMSQLPSEVTHYSCMPIEIPENDRFYQKFQQKCMNFVRSILAPRHDCSMGYSEQMNKLTHFIDASSIYGSTPEQTGELRSFHGGKLRVTDDFGRQLLPLSKDPEACLTMEQGSACYLSGDTRTNQMITLVVMHTIFLREHNRLAHNLALLNPQWNDDEIFLEARQILIAELQVIIYKEYLPILLGENTMREFDLNLEQGAKYSTNYDPTVEPSITNEFATAAFRFGHSAVDGQLKLYGTDKMEEIISLPEIMFYPSRMRHQQFLDEALNTLTTEPIQEVDASLSDALTNYMFRGGNPFGVDLAAINIQRGRDHGLRSYNDYRELVGLARIKEFNEFGSEIAQKLSLVYQSVDDIDLWIGGLLEEKPIGSLVGTTFRDIIADQFSRLKKGDRYFFENHPTTNPGHFTLEQLVELKKATLSRIICDNSDKMLLHRQAPNAFRKPGVSGNEFVACESSSSEILSIDLTLWQE